MIVIDILSLVDRLEGLLRDAKRVPLSNKLALDEGALVNLVDQMRLSIPDEIQQAERVLRDRDAIIARAQDEARRLLHEAQSQIDEERMRHIAEQEAQAIIGEAEQRARAFEQEAQLYAKGTLTDLAERLEAIQSVIRNGLAQIEAAETAEIQETVESA